MRVARSRALYRRTVLVHRVVTSTSAMIYLLMREDAMTLLQEQRRGHRPLGDYGDGRAHPDGDPMPRILVVEDHAELQRGLQINLQARQYDVTTAGTGREGLAAAARRPPDAVILDLALPDTDGTQIITELRRWYPAPIIVLSGRTSPDTKISALDAGADDYLTTPFVMGELLARLRAVLRRGHASPAQSQPQRALIGRWQIDPAAHRITRATATTHPATNDTLRLTPTEWAMLKLLLQRPGQLVSQTQLLTSVWGPGSQQHTNYLRFHMARLRRKLEDNPARPRYLLTEPGMGYRYQPEPDYAQIQEPLDPLPVLVTHR
jgi:two-component system, OmpR family, KDP operon response regulator KdpE